MIGPDVQMRVLGVAMLSCFALGVAAAAWAFTTLILGEATDESMFLLAWGAFFVFFGAGWLRAHAVAFVLLEETLFEGDDA